MLNAAMTIGHVSLGVSSPIETTQPGTNVVATKVYYPVFELATHQVILPWLEINSVANSTIAFILACTR